MTAVMIAKKADKRTNRSMIPVLLGALTLLAFQLLLWPCSGDQVLFTLGAQRLAQGGAYLTDFWDVKQPGIYWFYRLGLLLGGALGVRILEALLVIGSGLALGRRLESLHLGPAVVVLGPLLVLAPYVNLGFRNGVGQVEGLVNPLIVFSLLLVYERGVGQCRAWRWGVAGLIGGLIVTLKLLLAPDLLVIVLPAVILAVKRNRTSTMRALAAYAGGCLATVAIAAGLLLRATPAGLVWYTFFRLPFDMVANPSLHASVLTTCKYIAVMVVVVLPFLIAGLIALVRGRLPLLLRRPDIAVACLGLLVVHVVLGVAQMCTSYRFLSLSAPLGLLSIPGLVAITQLFDAGRRTSHPGIGPGLGHRMSIVALCILAAAPLAIGDLRFAETLRHTHFSWEPEHNVPFAQAMTHGTLLSDADTVRPMVQSSDSLFVLGDPEIYWSLGKRQALPIIGWDPQLYPAKIFAELDREFECVRPTWIFVADYSRPYVRAGAPEILSWLSANYRPISSPQGTWYRQSATETQGHSLACDAGAVAWWRRH